MAELPNTLEEAIVRAGIATQAALADGHTRLQVELVFPEIGLQTQSITLQFIPAFGQLSPELKVFFPDAGAAALARRDWGEVPFKIQDVGTGRTPIEDKVEPEDQIFLVITPSSVEVAEVEKLCNAAGERPVILLNPRLEETGAVGIGYAGRQLRERFLNTLETSYYLSPFEGGALMRGYPESWQVWQETGDGYQLITELPKKPTGEELDSILAGTTPTAEGSEALQPKKPNFFASLQRFMRALSR